MVYSEFSKGDYIANSDNKFAEKSLVFLFYISHLQLHPATARVHSNSIHNSRRIIKS